MLNSQHRAQNDLSNVRAGKCHFSDESPPGRLHFTREKPKPFTVDKAHMLWTPAPSGPIFPSPSLAHDAPTTRSHLLCWTQHTHFILGAFACALSLQTPRNLHVTLPNFLHVLLGPHHCTSLYPPTWSFSVTLEQVTFLRVRKDAVMMVTLVSAHAVWIMCFPPRLLSGNQGLGWFQSGST